MNLFSQKTLPYFLFALSAFFNASLAQGADEQASARPTLQVVSISEEPHFISAEQMAADFSAMHIKNMGYFLKYL